MGIVGENLKDLLCVYSLLTDEIVKSQHKIDGIDRTIKYCNRLNTEYWQDKRAEAVSYLNGLHRARDIVFKAINK